MALGIGSQFGTRGPATSRRPSLVDVAKTAAEDLLDLLASQIKLARVELAADARGAAKRVVRLAVFIPPLVVGYAFGMAAAAWWLSSYWGMPLALATVAGVQLGVGGVGMALVLRGFKRFELLARTSAEGTATAELAVAALSNREGASNV